MRRIGGTKMDYLVNVKIKWQQLIIGSALLIMGFGLLSLFEWTWWALFFTSILAWVVVFGPASKEIFTFPRKFWVIPCAALFYLIFGGVISALKKSIGFDWTSNPATGNLMLLIFKLPFMLMGEELLGIGVLEVAHNKGFSLTISNLISALVFGLMHVFVYWDGSIISTVIHVLLLQGAARLIFNYVYIITGRSIWGSWCTHVLVDLVALSL